MARTSALLVSLAAAAVLTVTGVATSSAAGGARATSTAQVAAAGHWVNTWTSMPQLTEPGNMPPAPFTQPGRVLADSTVRQTVHVSVGGTHLRLRFSNAFGGAALPITAVSVALPDGGRAGSGAVQAGTTRKVTFDGRSSTVVPVGAEAVSDPLDFDLRAGSNLTVTLYLADGQASDDITSHPGSRTTSYLVNGDHVDDEDLGGAATTAHWYFLSGVEVWSKSTTAAAVVLGDSLTDGRGSTTDGNDRWTDQLLARLRSSPRTAGVAVLNQAAGGNRVLNDGLGPNVLARFDRDVLAQSGVRWLILFEGVNDIGTAAPTEAAQRQTTEDLLAAYDQIVVRAHAQGIPVYGATLTPFGGNTGYDDPNGYREAARQAVNRWIRTSGRFDAVLDFDRAVRDPGQPRRLLPSLDVGDHLHLNPAGYRVLADAVPARLFGPDRPAPDFGLH
ncbi:SGNH/GDSL hydrolase family protein [Streptomyces sp. NEAU-sy36]|uniref:SGNH/GDSL hydrolase family protein n=1 Tax=unclassified Streptomyces TaxID=2593676 RepID=UPI0015D5FAD1|nr:MULTISPECIES: SGNH/GDSL hydrolase family protein [unclassified Streptomyces]QLJ03793.1 SGNH/GDSL hydrolase family protein [Streptomyces sp. NEAU-sy36]